ncbi:hypothetical protein [Kocuria sp. CPCC 205263]|uniref:hypothetical protein n=1 Tax=Kocuria sp. CPCC 205263 TaxID=3073555 RepID=UPI0034D5EC4C
MSTWTVQITIGTARRVDAPTVATLLAGAGPCQKVSCSHGAPGVTVLLGVEATTAAGAYGAALVLLVAEVLPRLAEPVLTDVLIGPGEQLLAAPQRPELSIPATGRDETALV